MNSFARNAVRVPFKAENQLRGIFLNHIDTSERRPPFKTVFIAKNRSPIAGDFLCFFITEYQSHTKGTVTSVTVSA